jgi:membrane protease YdiL (CAAX protease family)
MNKAFSTLGWLALLVLLGSAGFLGAAAALFPLAAVAHVAPSIALFGAGVGGNLFALSFCFALLPGARRAPDAAQRFGLAQGIWGLAGFGIAMASGYLLLTNILTIEGFILSIRHAAWQVDLSGYNFLLSGVLAGELCAALWVAWYLRRLGGARLHDGSPTGVAWRAAPGEAYVVAALCALGITGVVALFFHFFPPDMKAIQGLPEAKLFAGNGLAMVPLLLVAVFAGPVLEEIVFRGIAFAGLAVRLGPLWAGIVTTLVFIAAHAPEKLHYPPGFIDVGLMAASAAVLRVRYRSIRPGIVLHILYNTGAMLAAALLS